MAQYQTLPIHSYRWQLATAAGWITIAVDAAGIATLRKDPA